MDGTKGLTVQGEFKPAIFRPDQRLLQAVRNSNRWNWAFLMVNLEVLLRKRGGLMATLSPTDTVPRRAVSRLLPLGLNLGSQRTHVWPKSTQQAGQRAGIGTRPA